MKKVYFDNAATTQTDKDVAATVLEYMTNTFGNPGSVHAFGREARKAVDIAREQVAKLIGAQPNEIFFTSGGTESDNISIKGVAYANRNRGKHIITSAIEHHAVLEPCEALQKEGFDLTILPVDEFGRVNVETLKAAIRPDTILISIMYANNEIGTIEQVHEIGEIAHCHGVLFHTDAVQAYAQIPVSVQENHIDLLSASGHKFYGPKGTGFLYVRKGIQICQFMHGGQQERGRRAGTENVPGIVGMGMAAEIAADTLSIRMYAERKLQKYLVHNIMNKISGVTWNGPEPGSRNRLPGNINLSFTGMPAETVMIMLDMQRICVSAGSACASGSVDPSHVLMAIGCSEQEAECSLRLSLGKENTADEMDCVVKTLREAADRIRN